MDLAEKRAVLFARGEAAGFPYVSWCEPDGTASAWPAGRSAWTNRCLRAEEEEIMSAARALRMGTRTQMGEG